VILERGSELAHELWRGPYNGASSVLAYPEGKAALAAARRSNRLTQRLYREAVESFERRYEELAAVAVDGELAHDAGALASEFALRGYDAVHLATALSVAEHDVALVSWDRDLCRAASEAGLAVLGG
jgi:uncharacterized protein